MGDLKHDLMVKTCDPMNSECEFTTADGCEAETGECSCTVWDLIEKNVELEQQLAIVSKNCEDAMYNERQLQEQLAAETRSLHNCMDSNNLIASRRDELEKWYTKNAADAQLIRDLKARIAELEGWLWKVVKPIPIDDMVATKGYSWKEPALYRLLKALGGGDGAKGGL